MYVQLDKDLLAGFCRKWRSCRFFAFVYNYFMFFRQAFTYAYVGGL